VTLNPQFTITFVASGRGKAQCPPDENYPNGIALDMAPGIKRACITTLPYPAPECGYFIIDCQICKIHVAVTAAGRPDDPITVNIPCKGTGASGFRPVDDAERRENAGSGGTCREGENVAK